MAVALKGEALKNMRELKYFFLLLERLNKKMQKSGMRQLILET